jgi:hypothetical protein
MARVFFTWVGYRRIGTCSRNQRDRYLLRPGVWAFVGRRREDRQICVATRERMKANLSIPDGCKLAAQEAWRGTVLRGRPDGIDNPDANARLKYPSRESKEVH